ncbi:MAG TPA: hypothetical protein VM677_34070 [Actinokineospora sp.]|jgi:hypothetical protein|nr:hypothetical protein [Actinokineospora sp.]
MGSPSDTGRGTDVWFRTSLPLDQLAVELGADVRDVDGEDYWEWVIADFHGIEIDLCRTHTVPAGETDTRIFRLDGPPDGPRIFPPGPLAVLVAGLTRLKIDPVYVGELIPRRGNEFDRIVHERISG